MQDTTHQGARLEQVIAHFNLTQKAFAQRVTLSQAFVTNMVRGQKRISSRAINQITKNFPEVNLEWLLKGEGEMLRVEKGAAGAGEHHFPDVGKMMVEEPAAGYGGGVLERLAARVSELEKRVAELEAERRAEKT